MVDVPEPRDEALLDGLQRAAFGYFLEAANPINGLIADTYYAEKDGQVVRSGTPIIVLVVVGHALLARELALQHRRRRVRPVGVSDSGGARLDGSVRGG